MRIWPFACCLAVALALAAPPACGVNVTVNFTAQTGTSSLRYGTNEIANYVSGYPTGWTMSRQADTQIARAWIDVHMFERGFSSSPTNWNWSLFDNFMYALVHGSEATPMVCFAEAPPWMRDASGRPRDYTEFGDWCATIARRARDVLGYDIRPWYFECWNEPNNTGVWSVGAYMAMYDEWASRMRLVDATLQLGGPSTAWNPSDWIQAMLAPRRDVQFITWHRYGGWDYPGVKPDYQYLQETDSWYSSASSVQSWIDTYRPGESILNMCGEVGLNAYCCPIDTRIWDALCGPWYASVLRNLILGGADHESWFIGTELNGYHNYALWNNSGEGSYAYWVKVIFAPHVPADSRLFASSVSGSDLVEALAARTPAGDPTVVLINKSTSTMPITLSITGMSVNGGTRYTVDASTYSPFGGYSTAALPPGTVQSLTMNGYSVAVLALDDSVTASSPPGWLVAGWNLISLPNQPVDPTPSAVFGGIPLSGQLYEWDATAMGYLAPAAMNNTQGYWLHLDAGATVSYLGDPLAGAQEVTLGPAGWHLIGCPANGGVALVSLGVRSGAQTRAFAQAWAANWLAGTLYGWDPATRSYRACSANPWASTNLLHPWHGYWLRSMVDDLTIIFPAS
jgi:hypothetical protein